MQVLVIFAERSFSPLLRLSPVGKCTARACQRCIPGIAEFRAPAQVSRAIVRPIGAWLHGGTLSLSLCPLWGCRDWASSGFPRPARGFTSVVARPYVDHPTERGKLNENRTNRSHETTLVGTALVGPSPSMHPEWMPSWRTS